MGTNEQLVRAAQGGDQFVVAQLLTAGADPNSSDGAAYVVAVANNHVEIVDMLFPLVTNDVRSLGLEIASFNDNQYMVEYLYQHDHALQAINRLQHSDNHGGDRLLRNKLANAGVVAHSKIKKKLFH